jgi:hypothetical protein
MNSIDPTLGFETCRPPSPADANLQHFPNMPLEVSRLRDSGIANEADAEAFRCGALLWCAAWHQVPAGSLPADDPSLARLAGLGRDLRSWRRLRASALRGFRLFGDGRLYHPVVSQKVIEGWNSTRRASWYRACERQRKENKTRKDAGLSALPMPDKPAVIPLEWPTETAVVSAGLPPERPTENALKEGKEGKERKNLGGAPTGLPPEEQTSPLAAARAGGLDGPHAHDTAGLIATAAASLRVVS